jgi:hypothetical protein
VGGLIIGAAAMFVLGADSTSSQAGHYQISCGSEGSAMIVNTATGQAWAFQPTTTGQWKTDGDFFPAKNQ